MDSEKLATELLHEVKASAKRWFIAFCVMCVIEVATIGGFLWYISLPVEESSTTQSIEDAMHNEIHQIIGGDSDESKPENKL